MQAETLLGMSSLMQSVVGQDYLASCGGSTDLPNKTLVLPESPKCLSELKKKQQLESLAKDEDL